MVDKLNEFETIRKHLKKKRSFFLAVAFLGGVIICLIGISREQKILLFGGVLFFLVFFTLGVTAVKRRDKERFKENFIRWIIQKELGEGAIYQPDQGIKEDTFMKPGFFSYPDRYKSNDFIAGTYKEVSFVMADCVLEEENSSQDSNGHSKSSFMPYFKGRMIIVDGKKNNPNLVLKVIESKWFGSDNEGLLKYSTDSIQFNKKFNVYTSNKDNSDSILTPKIRQKLLDLKQSYRGTIFFAYQDGCFYLAINDGADQFEFSLTKPINKEYIKQLSHQILTPLAIIKDFGLADDNFFNEL